MFNLKYRSADKPKYHWNFFMDSFKHIKSYNATTVKDGKTKQSLPAVTIVFKTSFRAKTFLYWMQILGKVESYQASVYIEDSVEEIYKGLK